MSHTPRPGPMTRLIQRYFDRTLIAMTREPEVAATLSYMQTMLKTPAALVRPHAIRCAVRARESHVLHVLRRRAARRA